RSAEGNLRHRPVNVRLAAGLGCFAHGIPQNPPEKGPFMLRLRLEQDAVRQSRPRSAPRMNVFATNKIRLRSGALGLLLLCGWTAAPQGTGPGPAVGNSTQLPVPRFVSLRSDGVNFRA